MNLAQPTSHPRQRGQSLVELALFFPIFLIIIAGLVEVSNIVVTQNRVNNAARVGSRFGANGGENIGMSMAALNAVTQTLQLEADLWDIWAVRGVVNSAGTGFVPDSWEFDHVYGLGQTKAFDSVVEADIQQQVLERLQTDQAGNSSQPSIAAGLQFVGVYAIHDINSILGLDALPNLVGLNSVRALSVMRAESGAVVTTNGCDAFPIVIHEGVRSVLEPGSTSTAQNAWPTTIGYPTNPPLSYARLVSRGHVPNETFLNAREGYVYKIQNGSGPGNFGWLAWNVCESSQGDLVDALTWPGSSKDYRPLSGGCNPGGFTPRVRGYVEPGDPTDREMHIGDWVAGSTGAVNSSEGREQLQDHIDRGRHLRLLYYETADGTGSNVRYLIKGFVVMRLIAYHLPASGGTWIMAEFIRWDDSCGQPTN